MGQCELTILSVSGGQNILGHHTLPLPIRVNSDLFLPKGNIFYADPYFFPLSSLTPWTSNLYVSLNDLYLSHDSLPLLHTAKQPYVYNAGNYTFVV